MRYLTIALIPFLIFACKKTEQQPTPPNLPAFTCDNATDDGHFETWDSSELKLIFPNSLPTTYTIPDSAVPGYLKLVDMPSASVSLTNKQFSFRALYDTGRSWSFTFDLVDQSTGNIEGYGQIWRGGNPAKDTVMETVDLSKGKGLTPGCKRIYYHGDKITFKDSNLNNQTLNYHLDVLFKGHFDVEVN